MRFPLAGQDRGLIGQSLRSERLEESNGFRAFQTGRPFFCTVLRILFARSARQLPAKQGVKLGIQIL